MSNETFDIGAPIQVTDEEMTAASIIYRGVLGDAFHESNKRLNDAFEKVYDCARGKRAALESSLRDAVAEAPVSVLHQLVDEVLRANQTETDALGAVDRANAVLEATQQASCDARLELGEYVRAALKDRTADRVAVRVGSNVMICSRNGNINIVPLVEE